MMVVVMAAHQPRANHAHGARRAKATAGRTQAHPGQRVGGSAAADDGGVPVAAVAGHGGLRADANRPRHHPRQGERCVAVHSGHVLAENLPNGRCRFTLVLGRG